MKNYLKYSLWFTLLVWAILLILSYTPPLTICGHTFKKPDILGDVRVHLPDNSPPDSAIVLNTPAVKPAFADTCRTGMTCIEDYSDSTLRGMSPFYEILDSITRLNRPVRIGVFGDSFIEADILTADLREMLQQKFGGCGVGYVDITSPIKDFRPTVKHFFKGWRSYQPKDTLRFEQWRQGIASRYFIPYPNAYMELRGSSSYASRLDTCEQATIYFRNNHELQLAVRINNGNEEVYTLNPSAKVQKLTLQGKIGSVKWRIINGEQSVFYGVALEGEKGIAVDNISLRGSSGLSLPGIPEETLKDFNALRPYDLIILQYGLNIVTPRGVNYDFYQNGMRETIAHLKKCYPHAGILLVSMADRNYKTDSGEIRTMKGVKNLVRYQKNIAIENNIAFWNMFEAMGGEGSMADLVHARPSKANYDYAHINFRGGKVLAGLLYESIIYGKEQHDKRKAYLYE